MLAILFYFVLYVGIVLGIWSLIWLLYCFVAQSFWPGYGVISDPSYLQFVAVWVLLGLIAYVFKGGSK